MNIIIKSIKDASSLLSYDELKELIKYNFPTKNNSNYFRLSNRIKAEIYKEIIELNKLLEDTSDEVKPYMPKEKEIIETI